MILVTGGAGYIGSHVALALQAQGEHVVVIDNLVTGDKRAVLTDDFIIGDVGDPDCLKDLFNRYPIDAIIHLAASTSVPESITHPQQYYQNNVVAMLNLINVCCQFKVSHFVFSSSAAVYGIPQENIVTETSPCQPINPYGTTKWMGEKILHDVSQATSMNHISLRYFNVAGSDPQLRVGSYKKDETALIQRTLQVALNPHAPLKIFGTDYPTPDGTGIRDYIHVSDIAMAHVCALDYLRQQENSQVFNCGYGHGFSVREIIHAVEAVTGRTLPTQVESRRAGDPPMVIANNQRIRSDLNWQPHYDDLAEIIRHGWAWEKMKKNLSH